MDDMIIYSTKFSCFFGCAFVDTFVDTCVDMFVDMFARKSRVASAGMCANAFHDTRFSGVEECLENVQTRSQCFVLVDLRSQSRHAREFTRSGTRRRQCHDVETGLARCSAFASRARRRARWLN